MNVQLPVFIDCEHPNSTSIACRTGVCARAERYRRERRTFENISAFAVGQVVRDAYWLSEYEIVKAGSARKPWIIRCIAPGLKPDPVGRELTDYDNDPRWELAT